MIQNLKKRQKPKKMHFIKTEIPEIGEQITQRRSPVSATQCELQRFQASASDRKLASI